MARDIYYSVKGYNTSFERLKNNSAIPLKNRKLATEWIKKKESELFDSYDNAEREKWKIRHSKTLNKYVLLLSNVCLWFPDLKKITEKELLQFKNDFYSDKIRSSKGRIIVSKSDYVSKVIRSDFFKNYLGHAQIVEKVFAAKTRKKEPEVEFITLEDLELIVNKLTQKYSIVAAYIMFSAGVRVGTLLNLKAKDFELKHNVKTNMDYYLIHIKSDYTKSKKDRTVPIVIPKANKLLKSYLEHLKPEELLFPYSHQAISKALKQACMLSRVRTKPTKKIVTPHTLRRSAALYLLNKKYSIDQVKAMLGHKPSSTVIDRYVNYLGLGFENEINNTQNDYYEEVKQEMDSLKSQIIVMQQEKDKLKLEARRHAEQMREIAKGLEQVAHFPKLFKELESEIMKLKNKKSKN